MYFLVIFEWGAAPYPGIFKDVICGYPKKIRAA
jgi:hypothetical protein